MINLLPKEEKNILNREYIFRLLTVIFFLITILSVAFALLLLPSYFFSKTKEDLAIGQLEEFVMLNPDLDSKTLLETINNTNKNIRLLKNSMPLYMPSEAVVEKLLSLKPKSVYLTQILYAERSDKTVAVELHGTSTDRNTLRDFKTALEAEPSFANVDVPISNFLKKDNLDIIVSFTLK